MMSSAISGRAAKSKSLKRSTTAPSNLKRADFSAKRFSVLRAIGNALAENTRKSNTKGLSATAAASKSLYLKCAVSGWRTSTCRSCRPYLVLQNDAIPHWQCLGMSTADLERVIYYEEYVVIDPGHTDLERKQLLNDTEYREAKRNGAAMLLLPKWAAKRSATS